MIVVSICDTIWLHCVSFFFCFNVVAVRDYFQQDITDCFMIYITNRAKENMFLVDNYDSVYLQEVMCSK